MIVIPASLRSDFIHIVGMPIHIPLESTVHIAGIRNIDLVSGCSDDMISENLSPLTIPIGRPQTNVTADLPSLLHCMAAQNGKLTDDAILQPPGPSRAQGAANDFS